MPSELVRRVSDERLEEIVVRDLRLHSEHDEWFKLAADLRDARRDLAALEARHVKVVEALRAYRRMPIGPMAANDAMMVRPDWQRLAEQADAALAAEPGSTQG